MKTSLIFFPFYQASKKDRGIIAVICGLVNIFFKSHALRNFSNNKIVLVEISFYLMYIKMHGQENRPVTKERLKIYPFLGKRTKEIIF